MSLSSLNKLSVLIALVLSVLVIALGAYTRLVDAGLGCPDWPTCYGFLVLPTTESDVELANSRYENQPYEVEKAVPEVVHRIAAGMLGVMVLVIVITSWRRKISLKIPIILGAVVVFQAILGAWTVTLKLWPQVVTAHLLGGFATLALLYLHALRERYIASPKLPNSVFPITVCFLVFLVLQISLGGWTSANYAALACPDFPTCNGEMIPSMDFSEGFNIFQDIGPNYLGGNLSSDARVAIQMTHRVGAFIVLFLGIWLIWRLPPVLKTQIGILLGIQILLGILNVVMNLPLFVAVLHNLVAAVLLVSTTLILYASRSSARSSAG